MSNKANLAEQNELTMITHVNMGEHQVTMPENWQTHFDRANQFSLLDADNDRQTRPDSDYAQMYG